MAAGCATQKPYSAFETIPHDKSTTSSTRFELIDHFNAGVTKTRFGTQWHTHSLEGSRVELAPEAEDGVRYGASAAIEYDIQLGKEASISADLNGLDISRADLVVMLLRKKEFDLFDGKLYLRFTDESGRKESVEVHSYTRPYINGHGIEWLEVGVPRKAFDGVDFNRLRSFEFALAAGRGAKGRLVVDEIGFFNKADIVFKSALDNLSGFPKTIAPFNRASELLRIKDERQFFSEIAADTWRYFENLIDTETHLPVDHIRQGRVNGIGSYASPTNIAMYWLANVAAFDLSLIPKEKAVRNIEAGFETVLKLKRWSGFFYNYYNTRSLRTTREYISTVDNGWLAAALVVIRQAFPEELGSKATKLLGEMDFSKFYDPSNGQLRLGYETDKEKFTPYHYGLLMTEARLASYVAIGKGDLEPEHWARIYRTLPEEWDWQKQKPEGKEATLFGEPVFEGHYTFLNKKFVPSWGGSLFEFLSPALLVKEQKFGARGLGKNNEIVTDLHIEYALKERSYPVWGLAPCAVQNGVGWIYREYGIANLGSKEKGYSDRGVITPYASLLALEMRPREVIENLRKLLSRYPDIYGEYGFYDSVDTGKGIVNHQYLVLDQGMSFIAIANFLRSGVIQNYFHADPVGKKSEALLQEEAFSI